MNNIPKKDRVSGIDVVAMMLKNALTGKNEVRSLDRDTVIEGRERFEMDQSLLKPDMQFLTVCVGCGEEVEMADAMGCACGGFTCISCDIGEAETCDHEPPQE